MRGRLWHMWKEALSQHSDPIAAWASIVEDPEKSKSYKQARGKGGHVRVSWQKATKLISARSFIRSANTGRTALPVSPDSGHVDDQLCFRGQIHLSARRRNAQLL